MDSARPRTRNKNTMNQRKQNLPVSRNSRIKLGKLIEKTGKFSPEIEIQVQEIDKCQDSLLSCSLVVPIHNQESIIFSNLESFACNSSEDCEFIVIVDNCSDNTLIEVKRWVDQKFESHDNIKRFKIFISNVPLFETISDAIGIAAASGKYIIEIQADTHIEHKNFDKILVAFLKENTNLFLLSGRGIQRFESLFVLKKQTPFNSLLNFLNRLFTKIRLPYVATRFEFDKYGKTGRLGIRIERPQIIWNNSIFLGETVMRGPLAFEVAKYNKVGGFDTENFFLGNDDHDLAYRARKMFGWVSGYTPIKYSSPLAHGTTRKEKTRSEAIHFKHISNYYESRIIHSSLSHFLK